MNPGFGQVFCVIGSNPSYNEMASLPTEPL
ncbi:hypothetical protein R3I94_012250 [Phoxinus phoxinus]